jgi:prefoldin subunit 5
MRSLENESFGYPQEDTAEISPELSSLRAQIDTLERTVAETITQLETLDSMSPERDRFEEQLSRLQRELDALQIELNRAVLRKIVQ